MGAPSSHAAELDVAAASRLAGRSAETVRRWVWSGRLPARKRGNKLLIARTDLEHLLGASGKAKAASLADWIEGLEASGLKKEARDDSVAELVLEDRRARS